MQLTGALFAKQSMKLFAINPATNSLLSGYGYRPDDAGSSRAAYILLISESPC
jgi:hypothetical protein